MPCYRCGTRQDDPERGVSPWRRGVHADRQVLICPSCQATVDWMADLDRCPSCTSVHLVRRLGEVECRDCGSVAASGLGGHDAATFPQPGPALSAEEMSAGLAAEVEEALARVLRRTPRPASIT